MVFRWNLSDNKSPQVSRTLLSILAVLNNVVVWTVSTRPPTSKSSRPFSNPLVTVPNAPITIGIIVTFMFHSFFQFSSKVQVLILLFTFFLFYSVVSWDSKVDNFASCLLFVDYYEVWSSGRYYVCQSPIGVYVCYFLGHMLGLCIYHLFAWSNLNFLHISQWISLPSKSCLVLYSFCANLLHSLMIVRVIVSYLWPHNLHLLFCWVLSILALIWLVLMVLSCAAIRRVSISLLRFPFLSQVQVFWCEMLLISRLKRL